MSRARVLVVDDDLALAETLADGLAEQGFDAIACASSAEAARRLEEEPFDALVTDLRMPAIDGIGLLARSKRAAPERPVIVMTGYGAIESAVDAIRHGAHHYMTKPFATSELALFVRRALDEVSVRREARSLRETLRERAGLGTLVTASPAMREVFDVAQRVADAATPELFAAWPRRPHRSPPGWQSWRGCSPGARAAGGKNGAGVPRLRRAGARRGGQG